MSRIGTKPVAVPNGVTVTIQDRKVTVQGPKGTLEIEHRPEVTVQWEADESRVTVQRQDNSKPAKAYHGLTRALVANMVQGVTEGFKKELEISGVGWTARLQGKTLFLSVGYADVREVTIPDDVNVEVQGNKMTVTGVDRQAVGQVAATIRWHRPPEPYNGKGIKYSDEIIVRKEGKAFAGGS
ncbi:MAG: 50S ribosomal protein L6 [Phycisphaeraceae bacterium]